MVHSTPRVRLRCSGSEADAGGGGGGGCKRLLDFGTPELRLIELGTLAIRSSGGVSFISFHQPDSFSVERPERKMTPLQWDIVPDIVPSHVFFFLICGPNKDIQLFSRKEATCIFQ